MDINFVSSALLSLIVMKSNVKSTAMPKLLSKSKSANHCLRQSPTKSRMLTSKSWWLNLPAKLLTVKWPLMLTNMVPCFVTSWFIVSNWFKLQNSTLKSSRPPFTAVLPKISEQKSNKSDNSIKTFKRNSCHLGNYYKFIVIIFHTLMNSSFYTKS